MPPKKGKTVAEKNRKNVEIKTVGAGEVQSWLSKPPISMVELRHFLPFSNMTYIVNEAMSFSRSALCLF